MDRVRVFMFWPGHYPDKFYRVWIPANYCGRELYPHAVDVHWGQTLPWNEPYDCYWVHSIQEDAAIAYLEARKQAGCRIVWGLDDDYWALPLTETWVLPHLPAHDVLLDMADLLVVSTDTLAASLGCPDKTIVCPNIVEPFYPGLPARCTGPVRVLVAGAYVHDENIKAILTAPLLRLSREMRGRAEFIFLGGCPDRLKPFVTCIERVHYDDYWRTLADIAPDMWLVPMVSNQYMDCKTPLKWIEGTLLGATVIASDAPAYRVIHNGIDGLLVTDDWEGHIRYVCERLMGGQRELCAAARQRLHKEFSWGTPDSPGCLSWLEAFRRALA